MSFIAQPLVQDLALKGEEPLTAPAIVPVPPPAFQPPISVPIPPGPVTALAPAGQIRGEGGTPFGAWSQQVYVRPPVYLGFDGPPEPLVYPEVPNKGMYDQLIKEPLIIQAVENPPDTPPRPGERSIVTVPKTKDLARPPLNKTREQVPIPEEPAKPTVSGRVFGFDLSVVPWWLWLVGAAVVGRAVLR